MVAFTEPTSRGDSLPDDIALSGKAARRIVVMRTEEQFAPGRVEKGEARLTRAVDALPGWDQIAPDCVARLDVVLSGLGLGGLRREDSVSDIPAGTANVREDIVQD